MPAFAETQDVMLYIDHIYAYLKARSDDKVGRGRPERIPAEEDPVYKEWKESQLRFRCAGRCRLSSPPAFPCPWPQRARRTPPPRPATSSTRATEGGAPPPA